jgi:hypothetical protein
MMSFYYLSYRPPCDFTECPKNVFYRQSKFGVGSWYLRSTELLFRKMRTILEVEGGSGCTGAR